MHISIKLDQPCEIINVVPVNPLLSRCMIKVCYVGDQPNRNGSIITKDVAKDLANSLPGSPIVGYYNQEKEDFEEHNRMIDITGGKFEIKDTTRPYGFVPTDAKVWFQKYADDGVEHEYLCTEGILWTEQYPESKRVIAHGNNQSMELDENTVRGQWSTDENGYPEYFIINEAIISKLCILGEDVEPCFEGASITNVQFSFNESFTQQLYSLMQQFEEVLSKGGTTMTEEEKTIEEEFANQNEEEICPNCGKPISECKCGEDDEKKKEEYSASEEEEEETRYSLDEIPEYAALQQQYSELEESFNALKQNYSEMEAQLDELKTFKLSVDRKEKQEMIEKFYMLSDAEKKDVVDNIDNYSLDQIEEKLSVICFRNKVSFNDSSQETTPITYSFKNDNNNLDDMTPAWIKAIQDVAQNN